MNNISISKKSDNFQIFAVLWIILSSNSLVYCVFNMEISMIILFLIGLISVYMNKFISLKNFRVLVAIFIFVTINIIVNLNYFGGNNNIVILLIRCISLVFIMSFMSKDKFIYYFVNIMLVLSIISLISFSVMIFLPNAKLPFQTDIVHNGKYYVYTFYHTLGRWRILQRNSGIFGEPGLYQIFLNFALLMMFTNMSIFLKKISIKKYIISIILLITTILTTVSSTGYLCLALVLAIGVLGKSCSRKLKIKLLAIVIIATVAFLIVESHTGAIEDKIINQGGSFNTRYYDMEVSFELGFERIFGYGYGNEITSELLVQRGVLNNSNGLGSFMVSFGVFYCVIYLIYMYIRLKCFFNTNIINSVLVFVLFILFVMSQPIYSITLFVSFFFYWKKDFIEGENYE